MKENEKKIGIITLFNCYNYGAVLQAYATYKYIESLGYKNVEIIDYENKYESKMKNTFFYIFSGNIKEAFKRIIQYIIFGKNRNQKKGFSKFIKNMKKSSNTYKSEKELKKTNYDILISGSDQIWNPNIFNGIDTTYLLSFSENAKKYAISSSAGSYKYSDDEKEIIVKYLKEYSGISVREESLKNQLKDSIKDIFVSTDPTLLLSKEEWLNSMPNNNRYKEKESEYILVYIVDANLKQYIDEIKKIKEIIKKEVWFITPYKFKMKYIDKNIVSATPEDYLSLIENADFIITNSFHGVAFSTNFKKRFIALENHKNPNRVKNYLGRIKLEDRIIKNSNDIERIDINKIDLNYYNDLEKIINKTKQWIGDKIGQ